MSRIAVARLLCRWKQKAHHYRQPFNQLCSTTVRNMTTAWERSSLTTVAAIQMHCTNDKEANWEQGKALVQEAAYMGAKMVFLPECFDYVGEAREQTLSLAEPIEGHTINRYKQLAKQLGTWLSLGGFHNKPSNEEASGKIHNTHLLINSGGEICGKYDKTHLFDLEIPGLLRLKESDAIIPGSSIGPPVSTPVGTVGMAICYDMRFPELSIALRNQGAQILTYPSAFTVQTGMAHWHEILRCRAIENQCYVIAAAQHGRHNEKRSSYGHSLIVDPWGTVIAECSDGIGVCVARIDTTFMKQKVSQMPIQKHRRHDLYGHVTVAGNADPDSQPEYQFGQVVLKSSCVFHRTSLSLAFVNKKPVVPGHTLVIPIRKSERLSEMSAAEVADMFLTVQKVSTHMEQHLGSKALTITIQDGEDAGQSIKHVHVHILPRKPGDFQRDNDIYYELQDHDKNVKASELRSEEDMAQEAAVLRKLFL